MAEIDPKYVEKLEKFLDIFEHMVDEKFLEEFRSLIGRIEFLENKLSELEVQIIGSYDMTDGTINHRLENIELFHNFMSKICKDTAKGELRNNNNGSGYCTYNVDL